jgi:hypothetical protein
MAQPIFFIKFSLAFLIVFFAFVNVYAEGESLNVGPLRVEITIDAGGYYENDYTVKNNYNGTVSVSVSVDKKVSYKANENIELNDWLYVDTATFTLQPEETKKVHYKVQTSTAMIGNISGQVSFTTRPPGNEMMQAKMTLPIYVNIRGTEIIDFDILDFRLSDYFGKTLGTLSIRNNGNVHIMPMGTFTLTKGKKTRYKGEIRHGLIVFCETTRPDYEFQIPAEIKFEAGKYKMNISVVVKDKEVKKTYKVKVDKNGKMRVVK